MSEVTQPVSQSVCIVVVGAEKVCSLTVGISQYCQSVSSQLPPRTHGPASPGYPPVKIIGKILLNISPRRDAHLSSDLE